MWRACVGVYHSVHLVRNTNNLSQHPQPTFIPHRDTPSFTPTRVRASIWNITATYHIYFHYSRSRTYWCCCLLTNELSNKWMFSSKTINSHSLRCLPRVSFNTSDLCLFIGTKSFISYKQVCVRECVRVRCVSSFVYFTGFIFLSVYFHSRYVSFDDFIWLLLKIEFRLRAVLSPFRLAAQIAANIPLEEADVF